MLFRVFASSVVLLTACDQYRELYPTTASDDAGAGDASILPNDFDDAGLPAGDAGPGVSDAGSAVDAGLSDAGAGPVDAGSSDAGPGGSDAGAGPVDAGSTDAGAGVGDAGAIPPSVGPGPLIACNQTLPVTTDLSGLPLLESNPGAPIALFIDFNGGTYSGTPFGGYNRNGSPATFDAQEQAEIIDSFNHLSHYFAMFDVNVTTSDAVRVASPAWGWVLVTEDTPDGVALLSSNAIGRPTEAKSYCGAVSVRLEDADKSRRVAAMLGFNFLLENNGIWDQGVFYKWEDWPAWDQVYGPILGGGGYGQRNGWALGHNEADPVSIQDDLEVIRQRVVTVGASATGWRADDFSPTLPSAMCTAANGSVFVWGILERPDDVDLFTLPWSGGDLVLEGRARDVSTAVLTVEVLSGATVVGGLGTTAMLPAGTYQLRVKSRGGYAEIGSYEVRARH